MVIAGMTGSYSLGVFLLLRADDARLFVPGPLLSLSLGIGVSVVVFALIGGLAGAGLLLAPTRGFVHRRVGSFRGAYLTAALALLAFGLTSAVMAFLFQGSDAFYDLVYRIARSRRTAAYFGEHRAEVLDTLPGFLATQLAGVLASAALIAMRVGRTYRGASGYARALCVSVPMVATPFVIVAIGLFALVMA